MHTARRDALAATATQMGPLALDRPSAPVPLADGKPVPAPYLPGVVRPGSTLPVPESHCLLLAAPPAGPPWLPPLACCVQPPPQPVQTLLPHTARRGAATWEPSRRDQLHL